MKAKAWKYDPERPWGRFSGDHLETMHRTRQAAMAKERREIKSQRDADPYGSFELWECKVHLIPRNYSGGVW